jgi:phosphoribosylcarboxyaminoimidazole (NCAIR) mutase
MIVGALAGIDALMAILQMPKGVPIATMGIGKQGLINAAIMAKKIINV